MEHSSVSATIVGVEGNAAIVELEGGMRMSWPFSKMTPGFQSLLREGDPIGRKVRILLLPDEEAGREREMTAKAVLNEILKP